MSITSGGDMQSSQIKYLETQLGLARREIHNLRQQLKSLNFVHKKECSEIKEQLKNWRCMGCKGSEVTGKEGTEQGAENPNNLLTSKYIGKIYTDFPDKKGTPRQSLVCRNSVAKIQLCKEVFSNPNHALEGLEEFSHMWVLFHFHKNISNHVKAKVSPPRLNGIKTGVLATRSPHRPNPIGLSLVKIDKILGNDIYFSGVDMINETPVLDIKPYIPHYDNPVMVNLLDPQFSIESPVSCNSSAPPSDNHFHMEGDSETDLLVGNRYLSGPDERPNLDELFTRIGEREAPDGEEESTSSSVSTQRSNHSFVPTSEARIRTPSWINNSPVNTLAVHFKEHALFQLSQLGIEGEEKKNVIATVLREDPRSTYLRERWGGQRYIFRISEWYVSCKFDDTSHSVNVYRIFQNNGEVNS